MLINNSLPLYSPNNKLHNNGLKQIGKISQQVCRGDGKSDAGRSGDWRGGRDCYGACACR